MSSLDGKRILIVEDEVLVAALLEEMLVELGAIVVGPAHTVSKGLELARKAGVDGAVLDVNVNSVGIDPVADELAARRIPFIFATGYGSAARRIAGAAPIVEKPYSKDVVAAAMCAAFGLASRT